MHAGRRPQRHRRDPHGIPPALGQPGRQIVHPPHSAGPRQTSRHRAPGGPPPRRDRPGRLERVCHLGHAVHHNHNTTRHLIADMERLRDHLGIDRWLLHGGSWGSTLILAYAETHPERVSEIVIAAVTTTRRSEIDWLYRGAGRFFPEQWDRFLEGAGGTPRDGDIVAAYARLMEHPDPAVREKATADWCAWEDAVLSGETNGASHPYGDRPPAARLALVRICSHYFSHGAWLEEGALLRDAHRLAGIPGVLVHGRLDLAGPLDTAWELARAWPDAELVVVGNAGHLGSETTRAHVLDALDRFAGRG
ncbi:alpha/beta fold hydrolase [Streptomyces erythrochromogenes]|uniref:alpha/beta fold hydrolase n=1 Tax=Streptomyces erythrochromogenes TaxID=285574 RepID=UPI0036F4F78E